MEPVYLEELVSIAVCFNFSVILCATLWINTLRAKVQNLKLSLCAKEQLQDIVVYNFIKIMTSCTQIHRI